VAGEYAQYGVPTAIDISAPESAKSVTYPVSGGTTNTFTPPAGSVQFNANVTYTIDTGGSFTVGYGSGSTKNYTNPSAAYSGTVSTATTDSSESNAYNAIGQLINWNVSNSSGSSATSPSMKLLNIPYASGIGIPLNSGPVTVTASLLGANAAEVTGSYDYTVSAEEKTLTGIQISPRNQLYGGNNLQPSTGDYSYYCTGFYSDGTVESLGGEVTWTITPEADAAGTNMVISGGVATLKLAIPSEANPVDYQLTITATYQGKTDSTLIEISPPQQ